MGLPKMDDIASLIARIDALETRVAHQDRTIEDLNETVMAQWKEIESLTRQVARLDEQVREAQDRASSVREPERPPPHY
jgi:SlyX protein